MAQALALTGCACLLIGRHGAKLDLARGWGLDALLLARRHSPAPIRRRPMWWWIAPGRAEGLGLAMSLLRPRGMLVLKSTFHGEGGGNLTDFAVNEWTLVGSRCGPFAPALRLLGRGLIQTAPLIEATYPLSEGLAAPEHAARPGALKVLLRP